MLFNCLFFINDTATTEIYTLSLHDALPISGATASAQSARVDVNPGECLRASATRGVEPDRKSTRLNSSHTVISYAVFCLKKKKKEGPDHHTSARRAHHRSVKESGLLRQVCI